MIVKGNHLSERVGRCAHKILVSPYIHNLLSYEFKFPYKNQIFYFS